MATNGQVIEFYENRCCVCYSSFWQKRRGRMRRTCGDRCRKRLQRIRQQEKKQDQVREAVEPIGMVVQKEQAICPMCGKAMKQAKLGRKRKTCSNACRMRLWRKRNPRCLICGGHYKKEKYRKVQYYCSTRCRWRAENMEKLHKKRLRAMAKMASYRPDWIPRLGTGYREEIVPVRDGGVEVTREREPKPNYEPAESYAERLAREAEELARHEAEQMAELEEEKKQLEKKKRQEVADRIFHIFLFDTEW